MVARIDEALNTRLVALFLCGNFFCARARPFRSASSYEEDFLGFSYGFRPRRGAHDAMDALCVGIHSKKVSFILDAAIRSFFDEISPGSDFSL